MSGDPVAWALVIGSGLGYLILFARARFRIAQAHRQRDARRHAVETSRASRRRALAGPRVPPGPDPFVTTAPPQRSAVSRLELGERDAALGRCPVADVPAWVETIRDRAGRLVATVHVDVGLHEASNGRAYLWTQRALEDMARQLGALEVYSTPQRVTFHVHVPPGSKLGDMQFRTVSGPFSTQPHGIPRGK